MLKRLYRKIPYKCAYLIKRIYYFILGIRYGIRNLLLYGTTDMFNVVNIETSTLCNRRCYYCPNSIYERSLKKNERRMPEQLFKKIIDELAEIGYRGRLSPHSFNEPLLDERLPGLMEYAHKQLPKARIEIYTNGDFLDEAMLDRLYLAGVRYYSVTFHGSEEKAMMERIDRLNEFIKKKHYKIRINPVIFYPDTPLDRRTGLVRIDVPRYTDDVSCSYPTNPLVIEPGGKVILCCVDYLDEQVFGNINSEGLMDVWNKPRFKEIRKQLRHRVYKLDICKRCVGISENKK